MVSQGISRRLEYLIAGNDMDFLKIWHICIQIPVFCIHETGSTFRTNDTICGVVLRHGKSLNTSESGLRIILGIINEYRDFWQLRIAGNDMDF